MPKQHLTLEEKRETFRRHLKKVPTKNLVSPKLFNNYKANHLNKQEFRNYCFHEHFLRKQPENELQKTESQLQKLQPKVLTVSLDYI